MVEQKHDTINSLKRRCELLRVNRSTMYYKHKNKDLDAEMDIINEILDICRYYPCYGYRKIQVLLAAKGYHINHKKLQRLLSQQGLRAIYPKKKTSIGNKQHKVYPYLLRNLAIDRPNQAWQVDITYIKIKGGCLYLTCLIDIFSRKIMGWALSPFLETGPCIAALKMALENGMPEIVNSDQGSQFTSQLWTEFLASKGIQISMDGKGRWVDNKYVERLWRTIKYEIVFLYCLESVSQTRQVIAEFIEEYNSKRPHQSLNYHTPNTIYELKHIPSKQELFEALRVQYENGLKEARCA